MLDPTFRESYYEERCTLMMEDIDFGGILALLEDENPPLST
jgi:hypothetical protein